MIKVAVNMSILFALGAAIPAGANSGLIAHWTFKEGKGTSLKDSVSGCEGVIQGARWVHVGDQNALWFDGVDDYVDFGNPPTLCPSDEITVETWMCPDRVPPRGEPGVVGKAYQNYVLTYYKDGQCWWYTGQSGTNVKSPVFPGRWQHVVGTYDGSTLTLYVNGRIGDRKPARAGKIPSGVSFFMGKSEGDVQWTQSAHYGGMIGETRIYNRALTESEVREHYRTSFLTRQIGLHAFVLHPARELRVRMELRGFGLLPSGASVLVQAFKDGQAKPVAFTRITRIESWGTAECSLKSSMFVPGRYIVTAEVMNADMKRIGHKAEKKVVWPSPPSWEATDPRIKVLNMLVSELRSLRNLSGPQTIVDFTNPREGWVFLRVTSSVSARGKVAVLLPYGKGAESRLEQTSESPASLEAMRRLPAGKHTITVQCQGGARVTRLVIRSIPEIGYCRVDCGPQIKPYGPCDWQFLKQHILPHINLAVSRGAPSEKPLWEEWKRQGKRWIVETPLIGIGKSEGVSANEVEQGWIRDGRLDEPLLDGIIVDEFGAGDEPIWASWHEALRRIRDNPKYAGKVYYPYCVPLHTAQASREFAQTVKEAGWAVALERYLPEEPDEAAAHEALNTRVVEGVKSWEAAQPGIVRNMLIVWGFFLCAPNESTNINPTVDFKSFTDMQMNVLANDPTFFGLYGVTSYLSAYADEETIRWYGKLCRHYCIEGRTNRLTDYYNVRHIQNPDFAEGVAGWTIEPAEPGSITTGSADGFSWLQGRYPPTFLGNTFLLMRRCAQSPNRVHQTIKGLTPGKLYSVKMISGDLQEFRKGVSTRGAHAARLTVGNVDIIQDRTFQFPFSSCYAHTFGEFNAKNPYYMNLYNIVFRARAKEAELAISDWMSPESAGGPIGQELMFNFLEVQPYFS